MKSGGIEFNYFTQIRLILEVKFGGNLSYLLSIDICKYLWIAIDIHSFEIKLKNIIKCNKKNDAQYQMAHTLKVNQVSRKSW